MKKYPLILIAIVLLFITFAVSRGPLFVFLYRNDLSGLSVLCSPRYIFDNERSLKNAGQMERAHFINFFGKGRATKTLMEVTKLRLLTETDKLGWIKVYPKISSGTSSIPLLESWLSDSTKWEALAVYFFDMNYYNLTDPFPKKSLFSDRYPWEYKLFSIIWNLSSDEDRDAVLRYWIVACKKQNTEGAELYLITALGGKGNDKIVEGYSGEIKEILKRLPADSFEVRAFYKQYDTNKIWQPD